VECPFIEARRRAVPHLYNTKTSTVSFSCCPHCCTDTDVTYPSSVVVSLVSGYEQFNNRGVAFLTGEEKCRSFEL